MDHLAELLNLEEDVLDAGRHSEHVEVPKIIIDDIPTRTLVPEPQLAELLVEDGHFLFFASADNGAARRHSSSSSWWVKYESSRFSSQTELNNIFLVLQETHF